MSKYKDQTENIPPLSSEGNTEGAAQPSEPSAKTADMPTSTLITNKQLPPMLSGEISEKARQHAMLAKVSLLSLEKAGLCKLYTVLSEDGTTVMEIQVVFDPAVWTPDLGLRL